MDRQGGSGITAYPPDRADRPGSGGGAGDRRGEQHPQMLVRGADAPRALDRNTVQSVGQLKPTVIALRTHRQAPSCGETSPLLTMEGSLFRVLVAVAALFSVAAALPLDAWAAPKVLRNSDLLAVNPAPGPDIVGVSSGGAPWLIRLGSKAMLDADGGLKVEIKGLVFAATGTTTSSTGAVVSQVKATAICTGRPAGTSGLVSLSASGDAEIRETVAIPSACDDPIVLVQVASGRWIAVAGG
jgi:hypothetical protein